MSEASARARGANWNWSSGQGRWLRRLGVTVAAVLVILGSLALPAGCVNRVIPPVHVADPVRVYLVDHGRTPSLVLPRPDDTMGRYVYGDWRWYAQGRTGIGSGVAALLWPTRGGLGREVIHQAVSAGDVVEQIGVEVHAIYPLIVERELAERLQSRLDGIFAERADTMVHNPGNQLTFVHHPDRYTYFWNSNHQVASWLRELGVEVRGPAMNSMWEVRQPTGSGR
jgi:hypothetical protein